MQRTIPDSVKQRVLELAKTDPTGARKELGAALKLGKSQRNDLFKRVMDEAGVQPAQTGRDTEEITVKSSSLDSLDEVLKHAKIDKDAWDVTDWTLLKTHKTVKSGDQSAPSPRFDFRVKLKRKGGLTVDEMLAQFVKQAEAHAPKRFIVEPPKKGDGKYLYHINCPDAHFGRLSWGRETSGADSDLAIQELDYKRVIQSLCDKAPLDKIGRIMLLVGSDYFQTDTINDTTSAGTPQDTDSRWYKSFETGCRVAVDVIESLASRYPVDVVVCSGNHDVMRAVYLGFYLQAFFRNHRQVTIDNTPTQRKYYAWGKNLLGITHGSEEKIAQLPMIMMREKQDVISQFKHMAWFIGHTHAEAVRNINGVAIYTVPSIAAQDAWTASKGYVGNPRAAQAFLIDKDDGIVAVYYHTL